MVMGVVVLRHARGIGCRRDSRVLLPPPLPLPPLLLLSVCLRQCSSYLPRHGLLAPMSPLLHAAPPSSPPAPSSCPPTT